MVLNRICTLLLTQTLILACGVPKKVNQFHTVPPATDSISAPAETVETVLKKKFGELLGVAAENITDIKLYCFIEEWLNTPYKWGGTDKSGIDCSAFAQRLFADVYNCPIPRRSQDQYLLERSRLFTSTDYLLEGDIIFFRTSSEKQVSHVGVYLQNNWFINSSPKKGVHIARLDDQYWKKCYIAARRVVINKVNITGS